jgi:hypothetical protein
VAAEVAGNDGLCFQECTRGGTIYNLASGATSTGYGVHFIGHNNEINLITGNIGSGLNCVYFQDSVNGTSSGVTFTNFSFQTAVADGFVISGDAFDISTQQCTFNANGANGATVSGSGYNISFQDALWASAGNVTDNGVGNTTVASGSNGGTIANIATWSSPSAGVLDVASSSGFSSQGGTAYVAASGSTIAEITYTGTGTGTLTGCAYVSGSASGTVATGGAVTIAPANTTYDLNWSGTATGYVRDATFNSQIESAGTKGVQASVNIASGQNVQFNFIKFTGSNASSANWFTNPPAAALLVSSSGYDWYAGAPASGGANIQPADIGTGLASWTVEPAACSSNQFQGGGGTGYGTQFEVRSTVTISTLYMLLSTAGGTLTSGECYAGIYSSTGTQLGTTADQSSAWEGGTGLQTMTLTAYSAGSLTLQPGKYWACYFAVGTTQPKFMGGPGSPYFGAVNCGFTGANSRAATLFTGATTALPGTCTFTAGGGLIWFAVK